MVPHSAGAAAADVPPYVRRTYSRAFPPPLLLVGRRRRDRGGARERVVKRAVCRFLPRRTSIAQFRSRHYTDHRTHSSSSGGVGRVGWVGIFTSASQQCGTIVAPPPYVTLSIHTAAAAAVVRRRDTRSLRLGKTKLSWLALSHLHMHTSPSATLFRSSYTEALTHRRGCYPAAGSALGRGHY